MTLQTLTASLVLVAIATSIWLWVGRRPDPDQTALQVPPTPLEWVHESIDMEALGALPILEGNSVPRKEEDSARLLALFTVSAYTCSQRFNEIAEFDEVLRATFARDVQVYLVVASDDAESVEWLVLSRQLGMAAMYAPPVPLLDHLRRFRGSWVNDQMILIDRAKSLTLLRVPLLSLSTPFETKATLLAEIDGQL